MRTSDDQLERNAHHEAGHAIMARLFGFRIRSVTIVPDAHAEGSCKYTSSPTEGNIPVLMGLLLTVFAGIEAGDHVGEQAEGELRSDYKNIGRYFTDFVAATGTPLSDDEAQRVFDSAQDATRAVLELVWPAVELVAKELMRRGTLTGEDIDALLGPAVIETKMKEAA